MVDDRRKSYRIKVTLPCKLRLSAQMSVFARIVDASNSGVQLILDQPITIGSPVQLFLGESAHLESGPDLQLGGRVVWCRASQRPDEFATGLQFNDKCSAGLRTIVDFLRTHGVQEEGRKCHDLAIWGHHPVRFRVDAGPYLEGVSQAVSETEVRLTCPEFIDPPCTIEGWLLVSSREDPVLFLGELRACARRSDTEHEWVVKVAHLVG